MKCYEYLDELMKILHAIEFAAFYIEGRDGRMLRWQLPRAKLLGIQAMRSIPVLCPACHGIGFAFYTAQSHSTEEDPWVRRFICRGCGGIGQVDPSEDAK